MSRNKPCSLPLPLRRRGELTAVVLLLLVVLAGCGTAKRTVAERESAILDSVTAIHHAADVKVDSVRDAKEHAVSMASEHRTTDSTYVSETQSDTLMVRDSVYVSERNGVVTEQRWHWETRVVSNVRWREHIIRDTMLESQYETLRLQYDEMMQRWLATEDSITATHAIYNNEKKEEVRQSAPWYREFMIEIICILIAAIALLWTLKSLTR